MAAPTDQRAGVRPISFLLDSGGGLSDPVTLKVRPEDLTRTEPSRSTVHQTIGRGAQGWVDNFGLGLPSVTISGHTGWRATGYSAEDGVAAFEHLNTLVMQSYHAAKQAAIDTGRDPATVKLLFVDNLDNFAWNVVPVQFVLRRNKSRPLLMQYNITMQAIATSVDVPFSPASTVGGIMAGLASLTASINGITAQIRSIRQFIDRSLVAPVRDFLAKTTALYRAVTGAIREGLGIADQLISVARMVSQSAMNIFRTLSAVAGIPQLVKAKLIQVAAEYSNIFCVLNNALRSRSKYQDYNDFYGSSNCSSTTGGRPISPLSGANPFYSMFPTQQPLPVSFTQSAQTAIIATANSDVVANPMPPSVIADNVRTISSGMVVA